MLKNVVTALVAALIAGGSVFALAQANACGMNHDVEAEISAIKQRLQRFDRSSAKLPGLIRQANLAEETQQRVNNLKAERKDYDAVKASWDRNLLILGLLRTLDLPFIFKD